MKELVIIQRELKAPKDNFNKFGNFSYRSAEGILEAVKPLATENGCFITINEDLVEKANSRIFLQSTVSLENSEGKSVSATAFAELSEMKGMSAAQATGAASSYARKYALGNLFCLDDTKDADAQEDPSPPTPAPQKTNLPANTEHVGKDPMISDLQKENIATLAKKAGFDRAAVEKKIKSMKLKGVDGLKSTIDELNQAEAATIIGALTEAVKKK